MSELIKRYMQRLYTNSRTHQCRYFTRNVSVQTDYVAKGNIIKQSIGKIQINLVIMVYAVDIACQV